VAAVSEVRITPPDFPIRCECGSQEFDRWGPGFACRHCDLIQMRWLGTSEEVAAFHARRNTEARAKDAEDKGLPGLAAHIREQAAMQGPREALARAYDKACALLADDGQGGINREPTLAWDTAEHRQAMDAETDKHRARLMACAAAAFAEDNRSLLEQVYERAAREGAAVVRHTPDGLTIVSPGEYTRPVEARAASAGEGEKMNDDVYDTVNRNAAFAERPRQSAQRAGLGIPPNSMAQGRLGPDRSETVIRGDGDPVQEPTLPNLIAEARRLANQADGLVAVLDEHLSRLKGGRHMPPSAQDAEDSPVRPVLYELAEQQRRLRMALIHASEMTDTLARIIYAESSAG
jgi:hypothetical protein